MRSLFLVAAVAFAMGCGATNAHADWNPCGNEISSYSGDSYPTSVPGTDGSLVAVFLYQSNLYAQKLDGNGQAMWGTAGKPVCTYLAGTRIDRHAVPDGFGGTLVCWVDTRGGNENVYAQRLDANGDPLWTVDGVLLCDDPDVQRYLDLAADGLGGVWVVWEDQRPGNSTAIWGQHVRADGSVVGALTGIPICLASNRQLTPAVVGDGAGGAFCAWTDERNLGDWDIYAQRLKSGGGSQWTWNGLRVSTNPGDQVGVRARSDGAGGAILVWADAGGPHAQRIDVNGTLLWTSGEVQVGVGSSTYVTVEDGAGGVITAWFKYPPQSHLYTQRVDPDGNLLWGSSGAPVSLAATTFRGGLTMAPDLRGGALITWYDDRLSTGTTDLYVQQVDSGGSPRWQTNGALVCVPGGRGVLPSVAADGSGSGFVVWSESLTGDVLAKRLIDPAAVDVSVPGSRELATLTVGGVLPTPTGTRGTMELGLPRAAQLDIQLFDVAGRRVRSLFSGELGSGWHRVSLDLSAAPAPLPAGTYFYRVRAGGESATGKLVIRR